MQSPEFMERILSTECREKARQTMLDRYGFEYPCQNPEIFHKMLTSCYRKKLYTFPSGRIEYVQGYEPTCIDHLLEQYEENDLIVNCTEIPPVWYNNPTRDNQISRYYPDAYIISINAMIEVKSTYTLTKEIDKNKAKFSAVTKLGFSLHLYVYNDKKELVCKQMYNSDGTIESEHPVFECEKKQKEQQQIVDSLAI